MVTERVSRRPIVVGGLLLAAAAAVGFLLLALVSGEEPDLPPRAVPVERVLDDPATYLGREVTVTGQVDLLTDRAMTLGDGDLIVVATGRRNPRLEASGFAVGDAVYATGELRTLSAQEVEDRIPGTSLLPSQFQEFDRQPVLLADEVVPGR